MGFCTGVLSSWETPHSVACVGMLICGSGGFGMHSHATACCKGRACCSSSGPLPGVYQAHVGDGQQPQQQQCLMRHHPGDAPGVGVCLRSSLAVESREPSSEGTCTWCVRKPLKGEGARRCDQQP